MLVPTRLWEKHAIFLLVGAFALLVLVLVPGIGHEVNGSARWIRLGFMNFQVSELARVMLLTYIASYAVRRADELRSDFNGFHEAGRRARGRGRCCCCSSRTSARRRC